MSFIPGKQVRISAESSKNDFVDMLTSAIDISCGVGVWITASDLCGFLGVDPSHSNCIKLSAALSDVYPSIKRRRANGKNLILVPCRLK